MPSNWLWLQRLIHRMRAWRPVHGATWVEPSNEITQIVFSGSELALAEIQPPAVSMALTLDYESAGPYEEPVAADVVAEPASQPAPEKKPIPIRAA